MTRSCAPPCKRRPSIYHACQAHFGLPEIPEPLSFVVPAMIVHTYVYSKKYVVRPLFAFMFAQRSPLSSPIVSPYIRLECVLSLQFDNKEQHILHLAPIAGLVSALQFRDGRLWQKQTILVQGKNAASVTERASMSSPVRVPRQFNLCRLLISLDSKGRHTLSIWRASARLELAGRKNFCRQ